MINVIEALAQSPQLPLYVAQLNAFLAQEQHKRQKFYQSIAENDKAEFINGEIIFQSPAKLRHVEVSGTLLTLLKTFVTVHPVGIVGSEKILVSLTRNDYESDICFFSRKSISLHCRANAISCTILRD